MRTYELDSIVGFGKCKGYTVREIYQYSPTYLEWLIEFSSDFILKRRIIQIAKTDSIYKKIPCRNNRQDFNICNKSEGL